jgi:chemotaxis protein CheD
MNLSQLTPAHGDALRELSARSTAGARAALSQLLARDVDVDPPQVVVEGLAETVTRVEGMGGTDTVVYIEVLGDVAGHAALIVPALTRSAILRELSLAASDHEMRESAMMEIGNIMVSSYITELTRATHLTADVTPPIIGEAPASTLLELPLARAASDEDAVVCFDARLTLGTPLAMRSALHLYFFPAPGVLARLLTALGLDDEAGGEIRIPVRMGELAVASRKGEVLVASGVGSCIAVALVDSFAKVAAMAHVMLPKAPAVRKLGDRPTYAARYVDTAVPALIDALECAGGLRLRARAHLVGGGQMFHGAISNEMRISERNVMAIEEAIAATGIRVEQRELGGTVGRSLEVQVNPPLVTVRTLAHRSDRSA